MKIIANNHDKYLSFPRSYAPDGNAFIESETQCLTGGSSPQSVIPMQSIGARVGKIEGLKPTEVDDSSCRCSL